MVKMQSMLLIKFFTLHSLLVLSASQDFDFFYLVLQWPPSYCNMIQGSCLGNQPTNFVIRGFWPYRNNGSFSTYCNSSSYFDPTKILNIKDQLVVEWPPLPMPITDELTFWGHEWDKYGTCSLSVLDMQGYFVASTHSYAENDFINALTYAEIRPDGQKYELTSIKAAIKESSGFTPGIECDTALWIDGSQFSRIYMCVNSSGSGFIECPIYPTGHCDSSVTFPSPYSI